eukprot:TRINITY_DN32446_c0_g1_i1.p1 TRINITY_DN32446_c0_g1~~TRINITY_DN32446_c0_g1_i1.p1  ORF type:complete len:518 (+),score=113.63 TRINITY_DN32446_c0_g1_i1:78-1631(+)
MAQSEERQDLLGEEEEEEAVQTNRAPEVGAPLRPTRSIPLFGVAVIGLCFAIVGVAVWLRDSKTAQRLESEAAVSLNLRGGHESKEAASKDAVVDDTAVADSGDGDNGDDGGDGDADGGGEVDKEPGTAHIYFVGDSHADFNYLTRALLSTGHLNLVNGHPDWKRDGDAAEEWEIVITGDVLDKGSLPWKSLTLIKRLQEAWPEKLTFLLGNQEVQTLLGNKKFLSEGENPPSDWSKADRLGNLTAAEGSNGYGLVSWLLAQPVMHLKNRVLTMHGGLSENMYNKLKAEPQVATSCEAPGKVCGDAMVTFVNLNSTEYFKTVHECMIAAAGTDAVYKCDDTEKRPYWLAAENEKGTKSLGTEGVTVFRGYSENDKTWNAGSEKSCLEAKTVGKGLGAQILNVAHTTHEYNVRQLCKDPEDDDTVIVYNLDTSWQKCATLQGYADYPNSTGECDLGVNHIFHDPHKVGKGYGETQPSSLHIKFNLGYPVFREIKACSSTIAENLEFGVNCTAFSDGSS